ncbi:LOW QUALITY PROTEIN: UDP-glucuronosyltransferase 2A1-like [Panonychus citri]|uniref:LOW QUALITY PROTEIN: UDP-glucuronosyltransferase 2A1-like n=1 Tax=Panonychus citri TaxID=50023 RepID=UPI0023075B7D|nr:LOW QUALITY PROTEIN: UDP-glucuronosyltransferase 2A1-like [Panonychus citri]
MSSYNILITCICASGHISAICGFGELLVRHGHKVTFAHRLKNKHLADKRGFQFIAFDENIIGSLFENSVCDWIDANSVKFRMDPMVRFSNYSEEEKESLSLGIYQYRALNETLSEILKEHQFDAIVHDGMDFLECLYNSKTPLITSLSLVPSLLYSNAPPPFSGLSVKSDQELRQTFTEHFDDAHSKMTEKVNQLLKESGRSETFKMSNYLLPLKTIELLVRHGHKVTFAHRLKNKHLADRRVFQFIPFDENIIGSLFENSVCDWIDANSVKFRMDPMVRFSNYSEEEKESLSLGIYQYRALNETLSEILKEHQFDAIIHDGMDFLECLYNSKTPLITSLSLVPSLLYSNAPPPFSGLSVNSDQELRQTFTEHFDDAHSKMTEKVNQLLKESGRSETFKMSTYLLPLKTIGFYHYPADIDYVECGLKRPGWHRIDCYVRSPDEDSPFELPEKLKDKPGKLIYFSLGTGASADLVLMRKCLSAMSRSGHRFIVSIGQRGDQLQLADNMWGEPYINQIRAIEKVDLVITHGGNNTFMESLYHGKPMIVIPYFYDQLDNAQRVVDKEIGYRVNPWEFDEDYFLNCIEKVLNDQQLQERVKKISENMRNSNSGTQAVKMIEDLIVENKKKVKSPFT